MRIFESIIPVVVNPRQGKLRSPKPHRFVAVEEPVCAVEPREVIIGGLIGPRQVSRRSVLPSVEPEHMAEFVQKKAHRIQSVRGYCSDAHIGIGIKPDRIAQVGRFEDNFDVV